MKCKIHNCQQPAELTSDKSRRISCIRPIETGHAQQPIGISATWPIEEVNGLCRFHNINRFKCPIEEARNEYLRIKG